MRLAVMTGLISMLLCIHVAADEPTETYVARKHVLGRVFMSDAERRQLDVLRKTRGTVERPGNASSTAVTTKSDKQNTSHPAGYIVPSNGSPYQWIDGDFQRVEKIDIDSTDAPQEIRITRIVNDGADDDPSKKPAPQVDDDENRAPQ